MRKYKIDVLDKENNIIETINRKLYAECIGNFNPIFCRYKNQKKLVQSSYGDLSDPYRRTEKYLEKLYIEV